MARAIPFGLLFVPLLNSLALAQSSELPETVISASQYPLESARVGAAVTVLSGDKLRETGVQTVADALRAVPGVHVVASGPRGSVTSVFMRGADPRNLMVLIDGIEVNQLGFPGFDFADLPVDDIERIEVIRGPQSGIYGANANAGVIAIVTRSGKGLAKPKFDAKVEGGSRNTLSGSLNARGASGPIYGSVTFSDYITRGYNIARNGSEPDGSRALVMTGKGGIDLNEYLNIEGVVRYTDRFTKTDSQDFNFPPGPTYGLIVDGPGSYAYKSLANRLGATLTLFDGHWVQSAAIKRFAESTRAVDAFLGPFGADGTRTTYEYKSTLLYDTKILGGERHTASILVDQRREDYTQLGNPQEFIKKRLGLAGEYVLDLPTSTTLSGAARHDWNSALADVWTWRLALSQRIPTTATRIHASWGKGITDPDVFQLFGSSFNLPNPKLVPEQSIGRDIGVEQKWFEGRLVTDVTYFDNKFAKKVDLIFDPMLGGLIYVNGSGIARRHGVETSATFTPVGWLSLTATHTYTDARDSFGNPEIRRPRNSGSLETTVRFADNRAKATLGVVYNSIRKDFYFQPAGNLLVDLPGSTVVRALVSYDVTPQATLFVRAENVFDARYEEVFSYRAPPFAAYAGLKVKLGD
jgi:vitamin B12 transporter